MKDLTFYLQMVMLVLMHAKPEVLEKAKPILLEIRDFIDTLFPGE